ncbi:MAG: tRNA 2-thiocytidine biosynthesis TtcA family protein [Candidatus Saccharibacteria bacterium]
MGSKQLFTHVRNANIKYKLIESGDNVAVGVSGGKDSLVLINVLRLLLEYSPLKFNIIPISIDLGWHAEWMIVTEYLSKLGLPHHIIETNIGPTVFEERQESNPCALCANLRSGCLNKHAKLLGCNKVALAHHLDDAVTTLMMSMMFEGQFRCFKPITYLDRSDITIIRPLIYIEEQEIIKYTKANDLPVISNPCPASGHTNRETVQSFINDLEKRFPHARRRMLKALENADNNSFWHPEHLF